MCIGQIRVIFLGVWRTLYMSHEIVPQTTQILYSSIQDLYKYSPDI